MTIVIDIEKKVNSEIIAGRLNREFIMENAASKCLSFSELCKLHIAENESDALALTNDNRFVIPLLCEQNKNSNFSSYKYLITDYEAVDEDFYYKIWLRFLGIPWHILETDRCIVREMTEADVEPLYELYRDPSITEYTEPLFPDYEDELEYTYNYIHNVYEYFGFGTWVVIRKSDGKLIGRAGFNYRPDYEIPEIGYVFGTPYQHQGYALEVCGAIINYALEELDFESIMAFSCPQNLPSLKLLTKLGFRPDPNIPLPHEAIKDLGFELEAFTLSTYKNLIK